MNPSEKAALIDKYEAGGAAFDDVLSMEPALLTFRPSVDAWTIHEHVVHFLESDVAAFHRYRKAVAEPGGPAIGYDEEKWTPALNYHAVSLADSIAAFKLLRKIASAHLRTMVTRDWKALTYTHNSKGAIDLETWIEDYTDHVRFHREFIERNKKLFKKA